VVDTPEPEPTATAVPTPRPTATPLGELAPQAVAVGGIRFGCMKPADQPTVVGLSRIDNGQSFLNRVSAEARQCQGGQVGGLPVGAYNVVVKYQVTGEQVVTTVTVVEGEEVLAGLRPGGGGE
jgi:hypothetical protein